MSRDTVAHVDVAKWFSELDWAGFVPDLIVGLATGVVVGLVLVGFERRLADARHRAEDERWGERLEHVHTALSQPLPFTKRSYRPFGEVLEVIRGRTEGVEHMHPKVAKQFPELSLLIPLLEKLDALPLAADRLERATTDLLKQPMFDSDSGYIDVQDIGAKTVRSVVQVVRPEDPGAELFLNSAFPHNLDKRMRLNSEFRESAAGYRYLVREIEAFRQALIEYRNARRAEVMRKVFASLREPNYRMPSPRQVKREYRATLATVAPVLERERDRAYSTVPGC